MRLRFDDPKLFLDLVSIINELVLEVKVKVNKEGLIINAIDPANAAFISLVMPKTSFAEFSVEGEEEIGVNLEDFKQILKRTSNAPTLILETEDNLLNILAEDKHKRKFSLALIEVESEEKKLPEFKFNANVEMSSDLFATIINDAGIVADSCVFNIENGVFRIEARGSMNSAESELSEDISCEGKARAKYGLDYLIKIAKASKIAEKVKISFSDAYPARFDFLTEKVQLSYILAPRAEEE